MADVPNRESRTKHSYFYLWSICLLWVAASTSCFGLEVSPAMSWWKARTYCQTNYTGDLYIPEIEEVLNVPSSNPKPSTFYWVGAMEILQWKWTDNSSPFHRIGYMSSHKLHSKAKLPGNSVEQCYRHCNAFSSIGLSETRCYCLGGHKKLHFNTSANDELPCPGNFKEKCGNESGMSIYKTATAFSDSQKEDCVTTGKKGGAHEDWSQHFETENCEGTKYAICSEKDADVNQNCNQGAKRYRQCHDGICESCFRASWMNSSSTCNLVKVTLDNKNNIFNLLPNKTTHYWIGLRRKKVQMWIGGKEVESDYEVNGTGSLRCLALYNDKRWTPYWIPCIEDHEALCGSNIINSEKTSTEQAENSTHSIMTAETTSAEQAENSRQSMMTAETTSTEKAESSRHPIMTDEWTSTEQERTTPSEQANRVNSSLAGLYVGSGVGVFMLLCLLAAVIVVLKRQEKICFLKRRREACRTPGETENPNLVPVAQERGVAQNTSSTAQVHPNNPNTVSEVYSKVTKTKSKSVTIHDENGTKETRISYSNKDVDEDDTYNRAGQFKSVESDGVENCYSHVKADVENEYDIAGRKPEIEPLDDTYNHLGATGIHQESEEVENCNSHMQADVENDFDIAGGKQEHDRLDDTYNHLDAI